MFLSAGGKNAALVSGPLLVTTVHVGIVREPTLICSSSEAPNVALDCK